jgi:hypothetical protein
MRLLPVAIVLLLSSSTIPAQNVPNTTQSPPTVGADELHNYESCMMTVFIAKIDLLPPGLQQRTINTTQGPKVIQMLAGRRIMFAYGVGGDFFANVKPELLPADTWAVEKRDLLDELAAMVASEHDILPNKSLPGMMHGLEARGLDRTELKGGTLGIYLLFDNTRHIATSVYLLNQQPLTRRFQTIEQYRDLPLASSQPIPSASRRTSHCKRPVQSRQ